MPDIPNRTVVRTQQGFYSAETAKVNRHIPPGKMRMYFATIEVIEVDVAKEDPIFDATEYALLVALPSLIADAGDKERASIVRRALSQLRDNLDGNPDHLEPKKPR